jgi:hypothetical protein
VNDDGRRAERTVHRICADAPHLDLVYITVNRMRTMVVQLACLQTYVFTVTSSIVLSYLTIALRERES